MLLHEVIEFAAHRTPDAIALTFSDSVSGERHWTFASLWRDVVAMAEWIAARTEVGDRVAIVSDNRPEVVIALYAVPLAGTVAMFANTRLVPSEMIDLIGDVRPTLVLGSAEQIERIEPLLDEVPSVREVRSFEWLAGAAPAAPTAASRPLATDAADADTAWIIHTSGTTGRPKGALLTHRSLMAGVMSSALARPLAADEVYLFPFPLFHVAAYNVVHVHLRGRPVVLVAKFESVPVMAAIETHRVTSLSLAPTMISMLLDHPDRNNHDLTSLRNIYYGASAIPLDVLRRGLSEFGCGFGQGYGMTELSGNAAFLDADAHRLAADSAPHLLSAAGRVGPVGAFRLVDDGPDGSIVDVAAGDAGEIVVRGDQVISAYWERPEATAEAFVDGWFRTGDIGRFDAEGYLYVVDRRKDIIVSGGENVASLEVEDVLSAHPDIAQVAVVGVPDERWGERVVAVAVARPGTTLSEDEVLSWATGRLAGFKRPRRLLVVDELPVNASGKVLKRAVRAWAASTPT